MRPEPIQAGVIDGDSQWMLKISELLGPKLLHDPADKQEMTLWGAGKPNWQEESAARASKPKAVFWSPSGQD